MLRIHFTTEDLVRTRLAAAPDPLWEIACSLHRFQTPRGRWAYADWYREARTALAGNQLGTDVRRLLLPLFPRAVYFPDFLTPPETGADLRSGLSTILATPPARVRHEIGRLVEVTGAPVDMFRLAEKEVREALVGVLREYHGAVIAPHHDRMQACVDAELAWRGRELLLGGVHGLLDGMGPTMRWKPPVLEVDYYDGSRDLHLNGRGLRLVPSYFCWRDPVPFADPDLPPVLVYPLLHRRPETPGHEPDRSLAALLGRTRAAVLNVVAGGATNSELARAVSVSPASATHHTTVLRDAGLIASHRHANTVLHTLTPAGAALLRPGLATADAGAGREVSR